MSNIGCMLNDVVKSYKQTDILLRIAMTKHFFSTLAIHRYLLP